MSKLNDKITSIEQEMHNLKTNKQEDVDTLKDCLSDLDRIKHHLKELEDWIISGIKFLE